MLSARFRFAPCLALVALISSSFFLPPATMAAEPDGKLAAMARVMAVQDRNTNRLMENENVVGTSTGLNPAGNPIIKVYTAKAGVPGIPATLEDVPVTVEVTGVFVARADTTARWDRPVPIGVSTGHPDITAGTIGCRVKDAQGNLYALSNNHVFANVNLAQIGDDIIQPGSYDGGVVGADTIGTLSAFAQIDLKRRANNKIDAAIAICSSEMLATATPTDGYGTPKSTIVSAFVTQAVQKYGRTTVHTGGEVDATNATVTVRYGNRAARFVDQIVVTPGTFSAGGDSGSLVVVDGGADDRCPVGLLFAGSTSHTICNPIGEVLSAFNVTIDGEGDGPTNDAPAATITSPADGATFDSGAEIGFAGTATDTEDGNLGSSLAWTSSIDGSIGAGASVSAYLTDGIHTITASATDSGSATGSASISITVGTPPAEPTASVDAITYTTEGGKGGTRHLLVTVAIVDQSSNPVSGALVTIILRKAPQAWSDTAATGLDGTVAFSLKNATSGTYTTEVTAVSAAGLVWDGVTPPNSFTK